jgi:hypothetical protein
MSPENTWRLVMNQLGPSHGTPHQDAQDAQDAQAAAQAAWDAKCSEFNTILEQMLIEHHERESA